MEKHWASESSRGIFHLFNLYTESTVYKKPNYVYVYILDTNDGAMKTDGTNETPVTWNY